MARDKKSMIGFDPLAWLGDDSGGDKKNKTKDKVENEPKKTSKTVGKSKVNNITVLGHTVDEVSLTKGYVLATDVLDDVVEDFYKELFSQYPEVRPLFENTTEKSQALKLSSALKLLVDNLHDEVSLVSVLTEMGQRHQKYGALPEHYPIVAELLVASFKNKIGRSWTKAVSSAWLTLLGAVAETMCAAYTEELETDVLINNDADSLIVESEQRVDIEMDESGSELADDHPVLVLNGVQDISKSQSLKNDMLMLVNDNDEIDIDGSSVERIDGSALQLMCALFIYAKQNNLIIHWLDPSDALIRSSEILGVNKILELS